MNGGLFFRLRRRLAHCVTTLSIIFHAFSIVFLSMEGWAFFCAWIRSEIASSQFRERPAIFVFLHTLGLLFTPGLCPYTLRISYLWASPTILWVVESTVDVALSVQLDTHSAIMATDCSLNWRRFEALRGLLCVTEVGVASTRGRESMNERLQKTDYGVALCLV